MSKHKKEARDAVVAPVAEPATEAGPVAVDVTASADVPNVTADAPVASTEPVVVTAVKTFAAPEQAVEPVVPEVPAPNSKPVFVTSTGTASLEQLNARSHEVRGSSDQSRMLALEAARKALEAALKG